MFDDSYNYNWLGFGGGNPAHQRLVAVGFDPTEYIATAQLAPAPYTNQTAIIARYGGMQDVIAATDDTNTGQLDTTVLGQIITNVTQEINGYLSTIYPIPLAQTGTVAVIQVSAVSTDGLNSITNFNIIQGGNYLVVPGTNQFPVYLKYINPLANEHLWNVLNGNTTCFAGTGFNITVGYNSSAPFTVSGTPVIVSGGKNYNVGDLLVLTGGQSYFPDKLAIGATTLVCFDLQRRRLNPRENNLFAEQSKQMRHELEMIGNGELDLDGTYKRFYSATASWNQNSVLEGANSL